MKEKLFVIGSGDTSFKVAWWIKCILLICFLISALEV